MQFNTEKIPKKITPCPIMEAVIEIRFKPNAGIPKEVIPGLLFQPLQGADFSEFKTLPVMELPEFVRESDESLKYSALYMSPHRHTPNLHIQFGNRNFALVCQREYIGWSHLNEHLNKLIGLILSSTIITQIERIGLRYISFFDDKNIFNNTNTRFEVSGNSMLETGTTVRSEFQLSGMTCTLQMSNNAIVANQEMGSIIDIDVFQSFEDEPLLKASQIMEFVNKAHDVEKNVFFSLLKPEYLTKFNPEY